MVFLVFLMLSSLKNTKPSKKHNRHLGNERHGSIRLFGIMSNKRHGENVLRNIFITKKIKILNLIFFKRFTMFPQRRHPSAKG